MLTNEGAGTDLSVAGAFRSRPKDDGIAPVLRTSERHLTVAHGGLQHHQRVAAGLLDASERGANGCVVHDGRFGADAGIAESLQGGEAAVADDFVPLLIETWTLPSENKHTEGASGRL